MCYYLNSSTLFIQYLYVHSYQHGHNECVSSIHAVLCFVLIIKSLCHCTCCKLLLVPSPLNIAVMPFND